MVICSASVLDKRVHLVLSSALNSTILNPLGRIVTCCVPCSCCLSFLSVKVALLSAVCPTPAVGRLDRLLGSYAFKVPLTLRVYSESALAAWRRKQLTQVIKLSWYWATQQEQDAQQLTI